MYSRVCRSLFVFAVGIAFDTGHPFPVLAQASFQASASGQQAGSATPPRPPQLEVPMAREASGTSWLPDDTPMYAIHRQLGAWQLMFHENAFLQFLDEASDRVSDQAGSINWMMGMAQRKAGSGRLKFRAMFSAEPWTIGGCGYPDLLASGEQCQNENLHD